MVDSTLSSISDCREVSSSVNRVDNAESSCSLHSHNESRGELQNKNQGGEEKRKSSPLESEYILVLARLIRKVKNAWPILFLLWVVADAIGLNQLLDGSI